MGISHSFLKGSCLHQDRPMALVQFVEEKVSCIIGTRIVIRRVDFGAFAIHITISPFSSMKDLVWQHGQAVCCHQNEDEHRQLQSWFKEDEERETINAI
jgi:hypothetical protein